MGLILKVKSGPLSGQTLAVKADMVFGRQNATVNLNDPRVSTVHAKVTLAGGRWLLVDNASKNGIRDQAGERLDKVVLKDGVVFAIGDSQFEVSEVPDEALGDNAPKAIDPRPAKKPGKKPRYWHDVLAEFLEKNAEAFRDVIIPVAPMEPALILEFTRGVQVNSKWILGFGPRKVGLGSLDLPIWEPGAPGVCFEIHPSADGLIFKTNHPDVVRLNGREIDKDVLRMGDTIKILDTLIEVDFAE